MRIPNGALLAMALPVLLALPAGAHEVPDPSIMHNPRDGVVRLYGAGAPDADPQVKQFLDFLPSDEDAAIMKTEGWQR